jgi:hypothetical protein
VLNRKVYGRAASRYGKSVSVIPIMEGGDDKRLHYHAMIDCPADHLQEAFPDAIASSWRSTQWGYDQIDVQPQADEGWLAYMTKLRDKADFASAIDWINVHLP